jgi:hypothetical protein
VTAQAVAAPFLIGFPISLLYAFRIRRSLRDVEVSRAST